MNVQSGWQRRLKLCLLIVLLSTINRELLGQDYETPQVILSGGATVEWLPDGAVKVNGTATFISPIKAYSNVDGASITSSEMVLVSPDFVHSRSYKDRNPVKLVTNVQVKTANQHSAASENGRWNIIDGLIPEF